MALKPCIVRILTTDKYAHLGRNMTGVTKLLGCEVKRVGKGRVLGQVGACYCCQFCLEMDSEQIRIIVLFSVHVSGTSAFLNNWLMNN